MAPPLPVAARVPHTAKPPERCPHCGSKRLIRKGMRRKKLEIVQLWQCKLCRRVFTPAPAELRYKTYPLRVILDGVTFYNLGLSLAQAAAKVKSRHGYKTAPSTLASWMAEHRDLTTYSRLREQGHAQFPPNQTIRSRKLYHRQVYSFAYHRQKLALLREGRQHQRFAPLADFLERVPEICPDDLFQDGSRASQFPNFVSRNHLTVIEKENFATRTAALVIPTVGDNRLRHETLQRFMLANDSVTVAVEVPIWLTPDDIDALEVEHGISLLPEDGSRQALTGHIDFIQVRNGAVHILDYKPDARTNKPIAQLTLYALALTPARRASLVRHQMRVVQRGAILRVLSARASRRAARWRRGQMTRQFRVDNLVLTH
jgi:transposase-like protein